METKKTFQMEQNNVIEINQDQDLQNVNVNVNVNNVPGVINQNPQGNIGVIEQNDGGAGGIVIGHANEGEETVTIGIAEENDLATIMDKADDIEAEINQQIEFNRVDNLWNEIAQDEQREAELIREGEEIEKELFEQYVRQFIGFGSKINKMYESKRYTQSEIKMRIECFEKVFGSREDNELINSLDEETREKYRNVKNIINNLKNITENELDKHISRVYKKVDTRADQRENGRDSLTAAQINAIKNADRWLLKTYINESDGMENSIVFHLLNRPMRERLFAYYLIEHGYKKDISEITLIVSQTCYTPNLEEIKKTGFDLSKLSRVYENTCQAQNGIDIMEKAEIVRKQDANRNDNQRKEWQEVYEACQKFEEKRNAYNECSYINFLEKRRRKKEAQKANEELKTKLLEFQETFKKEVTANYEKGPQAYSKKEFFGDGVMASNGAKASLALSGAAIMDIADDMKNRAGENAVLLKEAGELSEIGGIISGVSSGIGTVLGAINLVTVLKGLKDLPGAIHSSDWNNVAAVVTETINKGGSALYSTASGVTGGAKVLANSTTVLPKASEAVASAAPYVAVFGIAVGGASMINGAITLKAAAHEKSMRESAAENFQKLRGDKKAENVQLTAEEQDEKIRTASFEDNIIAIEKRITGRKGITAGVKLVSGICTVAASSCTLAQQPLGAAIAGLVGFTVTVGGAIATRAMKRTEYKKVVDECLGLESIAKERFKSIKDQTGKYPGYFERGRIKDQLRQEMMARCGFTRVKAFYAEIMKTYAKHMYSKIEPLLNSPEQAESPEQEAYLDLVRALGLDIKRTDIAKDRLPTLQMIYQKLMS